MNELIILIGLAGAGKSTLGKALARKLQYRFVDTDHEIEAQTGVKIKEIFDIEGESGFRQREHKTLEKLLEDACATERLVLATGGGIVLLEENRALLRLQGIVVYLHATAEHCWQRLQHDRSRPLLQNDDPLGTLCKLYERRDPLYREVARHVIDVTHGTVDQLTEQIIRQLSVSS